MSLGAVGLLYGPSQFCSCCEQLPPAVIPDSFPQGASLVHSVGVGRESASLWSKGLVCLQPWKRQSQSHCGPKNNALTTCCNIFGLPGFPSCNAYHFTLFMWTSHDAMLISWLLSCCVPSSSLSLAQECCVFSKHP